MCGRYGLFCRPDVIAETFRVTVGIDLAPRYNIAPTQGAPVIRAGEPGGAARLGLLRWGLIPPWARGLSIGSRMINARAETLGQKPSFRAAFKKRRCLVPADGFYEWKKNRDGKQPFFIRMKSNKPLAFAGVWERWDHPGGEVESFAIVTCEANDLLRPLHDRMPVILPPETWDRWLDPAGEDTAALQKLLTPYLSGPMDAYPVGTAVNSPAHDGPELIEKIKTS